MPFVELTQQIKVVGGEGGGGIVDDELSPTSTNPVQNKVIKRELDNKAPAEHTHSYEDLTDKIKWIELE